MNKPEIISATRKQLLSLPERNWDRVATYHSLLVLPAANKHDSGWQNIVIIGCDTYYPTEICTNFSDDVEWRIFPPIMKFGSNCFSGQFRMDCAPGSKGFHFWGNSAVWEVGPSFSSIYVTLKAGEQAMKP